MSAFLRNIARRAAGLPAEVPVQANVASILSPAAFDSPSMMEAASMAPALQPVPSRAPGPVSKVSPASTQGVQRRAAAPAAPHSALPAAPPSAAPASSTPPVSPFIAPRLAPPPMFPAHPPSPASTFGIDTAPVVASPPAVPSRDQAVVETPAPPVVRELISQQSRELGESRVTPAPPAPAAKATAMPDSPRLPSEPTAKVERPTHETVLTENIERIFATQPVPLKSAAHAEGREMTVLEPRVREVVTSEANGPAATPRLGTRVEPRMSPQSRPGSEKRTVNVKIGSLELNLSSPAPAVPQPAERETSFDGFEEMRMYRI
jgi:hypothetical protein